MRVFLFLCIVLFFSCKKDPQILPNKPSQRFLNLTQHKWLMTHEYIDSTAYAKNNLNLWPLSTTDDFMSVYDTCDLTSKLVLLPNGVMQSYKGLSCDPLEPNESNIGNWKLINNDNDFVIVDQDTMHIVELTNNDFKMWYKVNTYVASQLVLTEYCMWTFKSTD